MLQSGVGQLRYLAFEVNLLICTSEAVPRTGSRLIQQTDFSEKVCLGLRRHRLERLNRETQMENDSAGRQAKC